MLQAHAFVLISNFLLHMQWQGLVLHGQNIPEFRVIPRDYFIEKCLYQSMAFIR